MAGGAPADVCATIAQQLGLDVHPSAPLTKGRGGGGSGLVPVAFGVHPEPVVSSEQG